jgi:HEAT repeat protein
MSGKAALEKKIESLHALRESPASAEKELRRALQDKNGFYVSKAAALAGELHLTALVPDLEAAFERFLKDPVKTDPQCWAKIAIVKTLRQWEHREPQIFLRGFRHVQMEPVWGGETDTAGPLRGACAIALVQCRLSDFEVLTHLTAGLADPEKTVRVDTASAIAALGSEMGTLLLRLKTLHGDEEPEVVGQCFASLLDLGRPEDVPFVAQFLKRSQDEEIQAEAIAALAQCKSEAALEILREEWKERLSAGLLKNPRKTERGAEQLLSGLAVRAAPFALRKTLILSLAGSPLPASADFLLSVLEEESGEAAEWVIQSLAASRFRGQARERVQALVERKADVKLCRLFSAQFSL